MRQVAVRAMVVLPWVFFVTRVPGWADPKHRDADTELRLLLKQAGFTGTIESQFEKRLGRSVNKRLANLGRLLFFDPVVGLHDDNACAGCHSPANGLGDSQSIAIGIENNRIVGRHRSGPRNQRRTPAVVNTAFYPALMWNGRFSSPSGDPFNNSRGFLFPPPEGSAEFPPNDPVIRHLLQAQAFIPPTELVEAAGFTGTRFQIGPRFDQFDDGKGERIPPADPGGFRNEPIRQAVLARLNRSPEYRELFGSVFPEVAAGGLIDFSMFGRAVAEFEFTMVFANAPIDRYARGNTGALSEDQKKGAVIFFGRGRCVSCHAVRGRSNEMFSDFEMHNTGVPQIAPLFGVGTGNVLFDGPGEDEDFGLEQITGNRSDRYKFRTSPLRNVGLQPAFFHNGAFTRLEDAIQHHLDPADSARRYNPFRAGIARDLIFRRGPSEPVLATLDPVLRTPLKLEPQEFEQLVSFVREGLLDERAAEHSLCRIVPPSVPSGRPVLAFEDCGKAGGRRSLSTPGEQ